MDPRYLEYALAYEIVQCFNCDNCVGFKHRVYRLEKKYCSINCLEKMENLEKENSENESEEEPKSPKSVIGPVKPSKLENEPTERPIQENEPETEPANQKEQKATKAAKKDIKIVVDEIFEGGFSDATSEKTLIVELQDFQEVESSFDSSLEYSRAVEVEVPVPKKKKEKKGYNELRNYEQFGESKKDKDEEYINMMDDLEKKAILEKFEKAKALKLKTTTTATEERDTQVNKKKTIKRSKKEPKFSLAEFADKDEEVDATNVVRFKKSDIITKPEGNSIKLDQKSKSKNIKRMLGSIRSGSIRGDDD